MEFSPVASPGTELPAADTVAVVKGSADPTKRARFEADGITTGTTRVITLPDRDFTAAGTDDLKSGVTLAVDSINGNDATAIRGNPGRPYLTVAAADAAAVKGDRTLVRAGTYQNARLTRQNAVALSGTTTRTGGLVSGTTTVAHGLAVGQIVALRGLTDISFDRRMKVTAVGSTTTFTADQRTGGSVANASATGGYLLMPAVYDFEPGAMLYGDPTDATAEAGAILYRVEDTPAWVEVHGRGEFIHAHATNVSAYTIVLKQDATKRPGIYRFEAAHVEGPGGFYIEHKLGNVVVRVDGDVIARTSLGAATLLGGEIDFECVRMRSATSALRLDPHGDDGNIAVRVNRSMYGETEAGIVFSIAINSGDYNVTVRCPLISGEIAGIAVATSEFARGTLTVQDSGIEGRAGPGFLGTGNLGAGPVTKLERCVVTGAAGFPAVELDYNASLVLNGTKLVAGAGAANCIAGAFSVELVGVSTANTPPAAGVVFTGAGQLICTVGANTVVYRAGGAMADIDAHVANVSNPHAVTKSQVGLGSVLNVDTTNASNITGGTLADARLSTNVPLKNVANTFTAAQTVATALVVTNTGGAVGTIKTNTGTPLQIQGGDNPLNSAVFQFWDSSTGFPGAYFDFRPGLDGKFRANNAGITVIHIAGATGNLGFFGATPVAKPTVTGSRGGNAALASLLTALASYGLVTDSST